MKNLTAAALVLSLSALPLIAGEKETDCGHQGDVASAIQKARLDGVKQEGVAEAIAATNPSWPERYNNAIPQLAAYIYQQRKRDLRKVDFGETLREQCIAQWDQIQEMKKKLNN